MDIYIGGVLDRNAALHGDVVAVEIKPPDQWKVLYDILDEYIENHKEKKSVYRLLESNITASVANIASSYNPLSINTNVKHFNKKKKGESLEKTNTEIVKVAKAEDHLEQCDSDVVVEGEMENYEVPPNSAKAVRKKKRRGGRGKKKGRKKSVKEQGGSDSETQDTQSKNAIVPEEAKEQELDNTTLEVVVELHNQDIHIADEILILPSKQDLSGLSHCDSDEDNAKVIVVPPDQLSECELTDDESGCSEILDYDRNREDQSFIQAQWEAFQEEIRKQNDCHQDVCSSDKYQVVAVPSDAKQLNIPFGATDIKKISSIDQLGFIKQEGVNVDHESKSDSVRLKVEEVLSANVVNSVNKDGHYISTVNTMEVYNLNTQSLQGDITFEEKSCKTEKSGVNHEKGTSDREICEQLDNLTLNDCCEEMKDSKNFKSRDQKKKAGGKRNKSVSEKLLSSLPNNTLGTPSSISSVEAGSASLKSCDHVSCKKEHTARDYPEQKCCKKMTCDLTNDQSMPVGLSHKREKQSSENNSCKFTNKLIDDNKNTQKSKENSGKKILAGQTNTQISEKLDCKELSILQIQQLDKWEKFVQRTAHVVHILDRKHTRMGAGTLKLFGDKNPNFAFFAPNDHRLPRMKIPMRQCPSDFFARHQDYEKRIFLCKIAQWREPKFALGELVRDVGAVGDVEVETEAMLLEHGIDYAEFPDTVLQDLPSLPWSIPLQEMKARTDLRDECIFTIDPSTARDLDDAVSCLPLPSGNYRVGVHIADVSYFIHEGTLLDEVASSRATSIYLVQKVIPMLPRVLCEHLCSLNPGEDRLAFSVVWELSPSGEVLGEWFGRTVIRSCVKLSYEHAQSMIENPDREWSDEEIPQITGPYSSCDISKAVNNLHTIAVKLRKKRFQDGALQLNQVKIAFNLDNETNMPNGFYVYEQKDSNKLIEEFMLLANMAVAHKIYKSFPNLAVLRRHPSPLENPLEGAAHALKAVGINLDISSAGALNKSITRYAGNDKYTIGRLQVITSMCSKPMQFARYFCSGYLTDKLEYKHYALNVPLYTHFTSPIRRYADLMVHRLLAAAVDSDRYGPPSRDSRTVQKVAEHCNDKKQTSKILQELSGELYLSLFIRQVKEMEEEGMVVMVLDRAFDVLVLQLGVIKRVYTDKLPLDKVLYTKSNGIMFLVLIWKAEKDCIPIKQKIGLFSHVRVSLQPVENDALKFQAVLLCPT